MFAVVPLPSQPTSIPSLSVTGIHFIVAGGLGAGPQVKGGTEALAQSGRAGVRGKAFPLCIILIWSRLLLIKLTQDFSPHPRLNYLVLP
jgi:hypothetical protein